VGSPNAAEACLSDWGSSTILGLPSVIGMPGVDLRVKEMLQYQDMQMFWLNDRSEEETDFAKFVSGLIE
jgi:hypothetical protein